MDEDLFLDQIFFLFFFVQYFNTGFQHVMTKHDSVYSV